MRGTRASALTWIKYRTAPASSIVRPYDRGHAVPALPPHLLSSRKDGSEDSLVKRDHEDVCTLSRRVMLQPLSVPLPDGVRFFPASACTVRSARGRRRRHRDTAHATRGLVAQRIRRAARGAACTRRGAPARPIARLVSLLGRWQYRRHAEPLAEQIGQLQFELPTKIRLPGGVTSTDWKEN